MHSLLSYGMYALFSLVSPFHLKAKKWIKGRKAWRSKFQCLENKQGKRLWMHCASLGEFEQGRPIVERWLKDDENRELILTFFSPSGYEQRKEYSLATAVMYLPLDTNKNAKDFLKLVQPDVVLFVKYEFWYHHLKRVLREEIPLILVSALFRKGHFVFSFWGVRTRNVLKRFSKIFVQNEDSAQQLKNRGFDNVSISGDTRYDRVYEQAQSGQKLIDIAKWKGESKVLILGSSWKEEEEFLLSRYESVKSSAYKVLIAPHDVSEGHIQKLVSLFDGDLIGRYTQGQLDKEILVLDTIGMLSRAYQYADLAIVGGGFGRGLHNILEPLAFGVPIFFGPEHSKYPEADLAVSEGVAFHLVDWETVLDKLPDKKAVSEFINKRTGAVEVVCDYLASL